MDYQESLALSYLPVIKVLWRKLVKTRNFRDLCPGVFAGQRPSLEAEGLRISLMKVIAQFRSLQMRSGW